VYFDALHVIQIFKTALISLDSEIAAIFGTRSRGFKSLRPDEERGYLVSWNRDCNWTVLFSALGAQ
jgi:hypothetical protein